MKITRILACTPAVLSLLFGVSLGAGRADMRPAVGLNKFDLAAQYIGTTAQPAARRGVGRAMARKAIVDAANVGVSYVRFAASGYFPVTFNTRGDLDLWRDDPTEYWSLYDELTKNLNANGVRFVPVLMWNQYQFPAMAGETLSQMIANPNSRSATLLRSYIADFINRYKDHPMLYFYELTDELNLYADMDQLGRCLRGEVAAVPPPCLSVGNYSTDQLIAFVKALADYVRSLDPVHRISSGFSIPRVGAEHLRRRPDWSPGGGDFGADSIDEFRKNIGDVHQGIDIMSVHFYNENGSNERLGIKGKTNANLLDIIKQAADTLGKQLFVGEFGDVAPYLGDDRNGLFAQNVLKKIVELRIPFSAPWIWEFYWTNTYTPDVRFNVEPGYTDLIISKVKDANQSLGNPIPPALSPDTIPPQVILTWPLDGTPLSDSQLVHAVASDNSGTVGNVEFAVDGMLRGDATKPPFQITLDTGSLAPGEHQIAARAYDRDGNWSEDSVNVGVIRGGPFGNIVASPNTCALLSGELTCSVAISWRAYVPVNAQVWVSFGGQFKNMACAPSGSTVIPWIARGTAYEFRLYSAKSCSATPDALQNLLGTVAVSAKELRRGRRRP